MTTSGIDPATFRLVAQYLNQMRYRVPPRYIDTTQKNIQAFVPLQCCAANDVQGHDIGPNSRVKHSKTWPLNMRPIDRNVGNQ